MLRPKLIPAIAVAALVFAVFGSTTLGEAARQLVLPKGSVGAAQLKANAVTGTKVKDGSLIAADFGAGQLPAGPQGPKGDKGDPGVRGQAGAKGESGARGATGPSGPAGSSGIGGYQVVTSPTIAVPPNRFVEAHVNCPGGKRALGGGVSSFVRYSVVKESAPLNGGLGWNAAVQNTVDAPTNMYVWAICANVTS